MKYSLYVMTIIAVLGCTHVDPRVVKGIDPEFYEYIDEFETYYGRSIGDITIGFTTIKGNAVGLCTRWSNGYRQIEIDREYWYRHGLSRTQKMGLIFHELGHCELNRDHSKEEIMIDLDQYRVGVPKSLMYPTVFYADYLLSLKEYYYDELFNPKKYKTKVIKLEQTDCVRDIEGF